MLSSIEELQLCALSKCQLVHTSKQNTYSDTFKPSIMVLMQMSVNTTVVVSMVTGHNDTFTLIHTKYQQFFKTTLYNLLTGKAVVQ